MVLVDGAKLVKGDWDCKDFIWRRKRAEWPLLLPVAGKERSWASFAGRASLADPHLRGGTEEAGLSLAGPAGFVKGVEGRGCGLSPRRKSVNAAPPTAIDTGTARTHPEAVALSSRSSRFEL